MLNLGVAESLQRGPKTATELAAEAGPNTNAEWLARVLKLAAELGLVRAVRATASGCRVCRTQLQQVVWQAR